MRLLSPDVLHSSSVRHLSLRTPFLLCSLSTEMALAMKSTMKAAMKAAMKAMKKAKVMKVMKKAMKTSIIAKGRMAKVMVFKGSKSKTVGGLTKEKLTKNKNGRVVSKAKSAIAKKRAQGGWFKAVAEARKALGIKGFQAVGGKTATGKALYAKAKSIYSA